VSQQSSIEWTEATWNPTTGCDRISPGCDHCYALTLAGRLKAMGQPRYQRDGDPRTSGPGFGLTLHEDKLEEPLRWRKPRVVFVNSMSDLFHKDVPADFIERVFGVMAQCPQHTFQVLTKRPKRMRDTLEVWQAAGWSPPPNVWLGTSIESRQYLSRVERLCETPAAVRFISAEPLLGPLAERMHCGTCCGDDGACPECAGVGWWWSMESLDLVGIDWLIVGGESGPDHRPIRAEWVRDLRDLCEYADTAFFFKQWGGTRPKSGGRLLDGRTWDEMPPRHSPEMSFAT
jgi:protein gp37